MAQRQKWADVIIAWANGEDIQFKNSTVGRFLDYDDRAGFIPCFNDPETEWRIKPRTIKIGDMEVPEPLREAPEKGSMFYLVTPHIGPSGLMWRHQYHDERWQSLGLCHATIEAAEAHAQALIAVSGGD